MIRRLVSNRTKQNHQIKLHSLLSSPNNIHIGFFLVKLNLHYIRLLPPRKSSSYAARKRVYTKDNS
jgi:hypothetical protein